MPLQVTEKTRAAKIPLNFSHHITGLEFFFGLGWYGIIASDLLSLRPMFSRQLNYNYKDLPKSFYIFFPLKLDQTLLLADFKRKALNIVDSYLFDYNSESYKSQTNARGNVIIFETDKQKKYYQCDSGATKVHNPFFYAFDDRPKNHIHQKSDEEIFSGSNLINRFFDKIDHEFSRLINSTASVFDHPFYDDKDVLNFIESKIKHEFLNGIHFPGIIASNLGDVASQIEVLKCIVSNDPTRKEVIKEKLLTALKSMQIYKIAEYDKTQFFSFQEIERIENMIFMLAYYFEKTQALTEKNIPKVVEKFIRLIHTQNKSIKYNVHFSTRIYDRELLSYFFSGLNGDRPISQFLNFYHILERELIDIKNSLCDENLFPDELLKKFKIIASECSSIQTVDGISNKENNWDRQKIYKIIKKYRNGIVHSKKKRGEFQIKPFIDEDNELLFWVYYVREIARTIIKSNQNKKT